MAFTSAQRNQIMTYLGYPALAADTRYAGYYPVYSQIDLIGGDPVTQAPVEALLVEIAALDVIVAAQGTITSSQGALKKVDEVEFYAPKDSLLTVSDIVTTLRRCRMLVKRLAQRMGGEHFIIADYFATGGGSGASGFSIGLG